jgi:NAD kinase
MLENKSEQWSEKQVSSGVWISTPIGSTAGIGSYGLPILPPESPQILVAVREPYVHATRPLLHQKFTYFPAKSDVFLSCEMSQGLLCIDGADFTLPLSYGDEFSIKSDSRFELKISKATIK